MAALRLRDRDAIITMEGLIFRVFGYSHPPNVSICDAEYAPARIFKSDNPKAFRAKGKRIFCKFYGDEGIKFIESNYPQYTVFHAPLHKRVIGVAHSDIAKVEKPDEKLRRLIKIEPEDELLEALHDVLNTVTEHSRLSTENFGVFGSILYGFYHPKFSDLDLVVYGRTNATRLCETLQDLYEEESSRLRNEFESEESVKGKHWRFRNYSPKEYVWHQRRKMIYALFNDDKGGRMIKTEFEPVKEWEEIRCAHFSETKIVQKGWVKMFARILEDRDAFFIPSIYDIEPITVLHGTRGADKSTRIISYMEEFRMQTYKDERVYVEGNLEEVTTSEGSFHQITLTYCPRYYEQVLKVAST